MLVAITRPMYEAAKKSLEAAPYYLSQDKFRFKEEVNVNLAKHKPDAVKGLAEILDGLKVAGAKLEAMLSAKMVDTIVAKHPMSGRDIKNMLRLCAMVAHDRQQGITDKLVAEMKLFKPTCE